MFGRRKLPSEFDELSQAISEAILHSKDVQKALDNLHEKKLLGQKNVISLVLNIEVLNMVLGKIKRGNPPEQRAASQKCPDHIDGKKLSAKERAFEEYFAHHFNEQEWLKKWRLQFDALSADFPSPEPHE
jgi:hypothetical protein